MYHASKVMYNIANIFNWILVILYVACIVLVGLSMGGVIQVENAGNFSSVGGLVTLIIGLLITILAIFLIRIAKAKDSGKGWDILFLIVGVFSGNIFLFLGGLFGIIANH